MNVTRLAIETTARLQREARRWQLGAHRPNRIDTPGPGQTSVWNFPRPPALEQVHERVTIEFAGGTIVDTRLALRVCETAAPPTYYCPRDSFPDDCLREIAGGSECEWKGTAQYYSLIIGDRTSRQAAWTYLTLQPEYSVLSDHIGVYASRVDRCTVAGHEVQAQPGEFYAGWITPDLVGPFKGDAGSDAW